MLQFETPMASPRDQSGFTLIEIIVVVAIIAFLTAMAVSTVQGTIPRTKIIADLTEVREEMIKGRTRAVRDGHLTKVCIYRSSDPTTLATNGARYFLLECDDFGAGGCSGYQTVCNTVLAANAPNFSAWLSASGVNVPTVAATSAVAQQNALVCPVWPATDPGGGKWCLLESYDLTSGAIHGADAVSINTFYQSNQAVYSNSVVPGPTALELTYSTDGTLLGSPYSPSLGAQSGFIDFTSVFACNPNPVNQACGPGVPQGAGSKFSLRYFLKYSLGGSVQVVSTL